MPINIKEIFKSDLDPNSNEFFSKDKVDKLNLNFNQLSDGGMIGPVGLKGPTGNMGIKGITGDTGPQGPIGLQGLPGENAFQQWTEFNNSTETYKTITPNFDSENNIEYQPTRFWIGYTNTEQTDELQTNQPIQVLKSFESNQSQLRLKNTNNINFDFKLNDNIIEIGNLSNITDYLIYQYRVDKTQIYMDDLNELFNITKSNFTFKSQNNKLKNVESKGIFKYNNLVNSDNILISSDNSGTAKWVNKSDIFGMFPIGSVISIPEFVFNTNNFNLSTIQNGMDPVKFKFGSGKVNTIYEGWYLCHGKTWTDGVITYETPELNAFEIEVDANGGEQIYISQSGTTSILGGGDFNMDATYENDEYSIQLTNNTQDNIIDFATTSGDFYQSKQIHIVYLQKPQLYWQLTEFDDIETTQITLSYGKGSFEIACIQFNLQIYAWTGNSTDWINGDLTNIQLYNISLDDLEPANTGWYAREGLARYWNGSEFTLSSSCPTQIELGYASSVIDDNINGDMSGKPTNTYTINADRIYDATILKNNIGQNATEGWYRETENNDNDNWRRYWDGDQFLGEAIQSAYVTNTQLKFGNNYEIVCNITQEYTSFYNSTFDTPFFSPGGNILDNIYNINSFIYVPKNWSTNSNVGEYPLVKIRNQNTPSQNQSFTVTSKSSGFLITPKRARINQNSTLQEPEDCN